MARSDDQAPPENRLVLFRANVTTIQPSSSAPDAASSNHLDSAKSGPPRVPAKFGAIHVDSSNDCHSRLLPVKMSSYRPMEASS